MFLLKDRRRPWRIGVPRPNSSFIERASEGRNGMWLEWVNGEAMRAGQALCRSVAKGQPFGSEPWTKQMVTRWKLGMTRRERETGIEGATKR
jgi:hypothetical protein